MSLAAPKVHRRGSGPAVVLLHCLGVDHRFWDGTVAALHDFTTLTYDLPGHGESAVPAPYAIADMSAQLAEVLRAEKIDHAHVAGASLGGLAAQHFAATYPQMTNKLALIDTTPGYDAAWQQNWRDRAATVRSQGVPALLEGLLKAWFTPDFLAADPPAVDYVRQTFARTPAEGYALASEALAAARLEPLAARIKARTLVMAGEQEAPLFIDAAKWLSANIAGAQLEWITPGKHAAVLENPAQFNAVLKRFLA